LVAYYLLLSLALSSQVLIYLLLLSLNAPTVLFVSVLFGTVLPVLKLALLLSLHNLPLPGLNGTPRTESRSIMENSYRKLFIPYLPLSHFRLCPLYRRFLGCFYFPSILSPGSISIYRSALVLVCLAPL
jgi:hypothetical protein